MTAHIPAASLASASLVVKQFAVCSPLPAELEPWLAMHQPHPIFATPAWFGQLAKFEQEIDYPGSKREYLWLVIYQKDVPMLAAPIEKTGGRLDHTHLRLLTNFYTPKTDLFYDRQKLSAQQAWQYLIEGFRQAYPKWLSFQALPVTAEQRQHIESGFGKRNCAAFSYFHTDNYTAQVKTIEEYWGNRPSKLKNTLRRKAKQLGNVAHRFELTAQPDALQIENYWKIYQTSWKQQEPSRSFIDWLVKWSAERQLLRIAYLYIDNQVVAAQLWLVLDRTAYIFKLAQDLNANQFSPGSLLTEYIINSLADADNIAGIDFLLGRDQFKELWMDSKDPIFGMEIFNRRNFAGKILPLFLRMKNFLMDRRASFLTRTR